MANKLNKFWPTFFWCVCVCVCVYIYTHYRYSRKRYAGMFRYQNILFQWLNRNGFQNRIHKALNQLSSLLFLFLFFPFKAFLQFTYCSFCFGTVTLSLNKKRRNYADNLILVQEDLAKMGVMIRHYNNKELRGYVRVSVGKPEHTDVLMDCLRRLSWFFACAGASF